jgi:hypothetical protein
VATPAAAIVAAKLSKKAIPNPKMNTHKKMFFSIRV